MSKVVHSKEDAIDLLENFSIIEKAEYFRRLDEYVGLLYEWRDINEASLESRAVSSTRKRKESTVAGVIIGIFGIGVFLHYFGMYEFDIGVEVLPVVLIILIAHEMKSMNLATELKRLTRERKRLEREIDATNITCHNHHGFLGDARLSDAFDGEHLRRSIADELPLATLRAMGVKGVLGTRQY